MFTDRQYSQKLRNLSTELLCHKKVRIDMTNDLLLFKTCSFPES